MGALALAPMLAGPSCTAAEPAIVWRAKPGYNLAPDPAAADLNLDGSLEIIALSLQGEVTVYDPVRGKALWSAKLPSKGKFQYAPVTGSFTGDGTIDVLAISKNGELSLLDGLTGTLITQFEVNFEPQVPPTVLPVESAEIPVTQMRESVALLGPGGNLTAYLINSKGQVDLYFQITLPGINKLPIAVGQTGYSRPAPHLVTVNNQGLLTVVSAKQQPPEMMSYQIPGRRISDSWTAVGDINNDGKEDVVVADDGGFLYAIDIQGEKPVNIWEPASVFDPPSSPPVIVDVNDDGRGDILVPKSRKYVLVNGATGKTDLWEPPEYNHEYPMTSPPAIFSGADGRVYAAFSDAATKLTVLDVLHRSIAADAGGKPIQIDVKTTANTSLIAGAIRGRGDSEVFLLGFSNGVGVLTGLGIPAKEGALPWLGLGAGTRRTSSISTSYGQYLNEQTRQLKGRVDERIAEAREAYSKKEWARAVENAEEALAANPHRAEAISLRRSAWVRANLLLLIIGGLAGLVAGGLAIWQGSILALRFIRLRMITRALAKGDQAKAGGLLLAVHLGSPRNKRYVRELADLYVQTKNFNAMTARVFVRAREAFPDEEKYIKALATAHSSEGRRDAEASRAYADMVRVSAHPGPWAFVLGQTYAALGEDRQALEAFTKAMRHGFADPKMNEALADLYVRMDMHQPEILPVLAEFLDRRETDEKFLRIYCRASVAARNYDENAERAAGWLLKIDPTERAAHVIMSSRLLQGGKVKQSLGHAESILEGDPNDSIGLRLLGACYAAENRLDSTAMHIFNRALAANPEAQEILVAVSHGFIQSGREDDEARQIYLRALIGHPKEETILIQLARMARQKTDDDLTIRAVETLIEMGRGSRELVMQLAEAYARKGVLEAKAEPIYREALHYQPDHRTIAALLATAYMRGKRVDAEAVAVYETVYGADPSRLDIGKQLARAYDAADLAEKTLKITRQLIEADPSDDEMQKLSANASAALDQMDSAIAGYEQLLERNPEDGETLIRLAVMYGRKRQTDAKSLKVYQRAVRLQPEDHEIHAALARAWVAQENWEQAVTTIKHLLSHSPKKIGVAIALMESLVDPTRTSIQMRWFLAETLIYDGRLREAMDHLAQIIRIDPGQGERALGCYDRILDKNPRDARAHQQRGRVLRAIGREADARQSLEQAQRHAPADESILRDLIELYQSLLAKRESTDIRFQLGKVAMKAAKYDLAISCFQKTDKDYRWEGESIRLLAQCFMMKGMLDLALQELRRLQMEGDVKEIAYELGQRYESVNDARGAREVYKAIFAADIGYKDVKGKLEGLQEAVDDAMTRERTAIQASLSEVAKTRYELIQELGRGAMGIVYKARDNELDEMVALKILPDTLGRNTEALRRFRQEARNARRLSHPNIVRIHDIGEEMGRKYISMEFVQGGDMRQRILDMKRNLPFPETLHYALQICDALIAAHDAGIVHRDIKPANIMINQKKRVKVTDFGIAKMIEETPSADSTRAGAVIGTPLYMSPEQVQGKPVDHRADIYSFGIMLYEMANGLPPFTEGDLSYHHVFTEPKPFSRPVPEAFQKIVMKCLAKNADDRWQDARQILAELKKIEIPDPFEP